MNFGDVTDWFIPENSPQSGRIYPGQLPVPKDLFDAVVLLRDKARKASGLSRDYRIDHDDVMFRGHRQVTIEGVLHILRRVSTETPDIANLGFPNEVRHILTSPKFGANGGLVLICGEPGMGKSTSMAAIVMNRIRDGAFCLTVEDPPEFSMHGDYPSTRRAGKCVQVPADGASFAGDLRDALRCYPSNVRGSILMVGEVRDSDTAAHILRTAVNGQLVFTTLHAGTRVGAIERLIGMAIDSMGPEEAKGLLSNSIRAVIVQRLHDGHLEVEAIFSLSPDSPIAARIKVGNFQLLSSEISQQDTWLRNNMLISRIMNGGKL